MIQIVERRSLGQRMRHALRTLLRCGRICRRYAVRFDGRWLDDCFAWGWLDH